MAVGQQQAEAFAVGLVKMAEKADKALSERVVSGFEFETGGQKGGQHGVFDDGIEQVVLAFKIMIECSSRDVRLIADVLDADVGISAGAQKLEKAVL